MKLNNDCIRDILLFIEDKTDFENDFINVNDIAKKLNTYDTNTLYYHIKMIDQADLVDHISWADNRPYIISNLSWEGHQYIDNIRDDKVWKMIQDHTKKLSSVSLQLLISLAPTFVEKILFKS